jgi:hypothetical protein
MSSERLLWRVRGSQRRPPAMGGNPTFAEATVRGEVAQTFPQQRPAFGTRPLALRRVRQEPLQLGVSRVLRPLHSSVPLRSGLHLLMADFSGSTSQVV